MIKVSPIAPTGKQYSGGPELGFYIHHRKDLIELKTFYYEDRAEEARQKIAPKGITTDDQDRTIEVMAAEAPDPITRVDVDDWNVAHVTHGYYEEKLDADEPVFFPTSQTVRIAMDGTVIQKGEHHVQQG